MDPVDAAEIEAFGFRLRCAREAKDWTIEHLAKKAAVGVATVSRHELGEGGCGVTILLRYCRVLDTTPNALLGWKEKHGTRPV